MKKKLNLLTGMFLALALSASMMVTAAAVNTVDPEGDTGTITIQLTELGKEEKTPVSGVTVTLHQVGTGRVENSNLYFDLLPELQEVKTESGERITLDGLTAGKNTEYAAALKEVSSEILGEVPNWELKTEKDGKAVFDNEGKGMPVGVYLVQSKENSDYEEIVSFLMYLPMMNEENTEWEMDVSANPKVEEKKHDRPDKPDKPDTPDVPDDPGEDLPDDPVPSGGKDPGEELEDPDVPMGGLPQTGLLQWPIPVMTAAGLLLVALGLASERKRKAHN